MSMSSTNRAGIGAERKPSRWTASAAAICLAALVVTSGCGDPKPSTSQPAGGAPPAVSRPAASAAQPPDESIDLGKLPGKIHIVQPGDTLYSLAEHYYGQGKFYGKILAANRNRLEDPNNLPVGMKLIIRP
jgi:nucleoid-associated protein YgaU